MFNITPVVRNLIVINVIVFLLQNFLPVGSSRCDEFLYNPGLSGLISLWPIGSCAFAPYPVFYLHVRAWRYGAYLFQHAGAGLFCADAGKLLGEKKFLVFYIA